MLNVGSELPTMAPASAEAATKQPAALGEIVKSGTETPDSVIGHFTDELEGWMGAGGKSKGIRRPS